MPRVIRDVPYDEVELKLHKWMQDNGGLIAMLKDTRRTCRGCNQPIEDGEVCHVTAQRGQSVVTVPCHDGHREAARANALEDKSWQNGSHYAG